MPCFAFEDFIPVVHAGAFVDPTAVLIGDVIIGGACYIGPNAVLRGDMGRVEVRPGANVQDNCVLHSFPGADMVVEEDGHIGHAAVLHGCRIGRDAMVGMGAVVMDGAQIGEQSIVGALAFVKANMKTPPRTLAIGSPARVVRDLTAEEIAWKQAGTREYHRLAERCLRSLRPCEPLATEEPDRPRLGGGMLPLADHRVQSAPDDAQ